MRLYGKGRKERLCPLWSETVSLLRGLLRRQPRADDEPVFVNRYGVPLGASGVRYKLANYVEAAARAVPSLTSKHVTPHSFRHATAVHLVAAGVDITVIRSWLGHVMKEDPKEILRASRDADKITGYVLGLEKERLPTNMEKLPQVERPAAPEKAERQPALRRVRAAGGRDR